MLKRDEIADPKSCLNKAAGDEPLFVLRAQDVTAPRTIETWLRLNPQLPEAKYQEAVACIDAMRHWHSRKLPD